MGEIVPFPARTSYSSLSSFSPLSTGDSGEPRPARPRAVRPAGLAAHPNQQPNQPTDPIPIHQFRRQLNVKLSQLVNRQCTVTVLEGTDDEFTVSYRPSALNDELMESMEAVIGAASAPAPAEDGEDGEAQAAQPQPSSAERTRANITWLLAMVSGWSLTEDDDKTAVPVSEEVLRSIGIINQAAIMTAISADLNAGEASEKTSTSTS